jgi:hypothetical protein
MVELALPTFSHGLNWSQLDPTEMQNMVRILRSAFNLTGGPGITVTVNETGITIAATDVQKFVSHSFRYVVVVQEPEDGDDFVIVREVRYDESRPPENGKHFYQWASPDDTDTVEAFPVFGTKAIDYAGFFWDVAEKGEPKLETPFLAMNKFATKRIVWKPPRGGGGVDMAVVREAAPDDSLFLTVQRVIPDNDDPWTGGMMADGGAEIVRVWPRQKAADFKPFVWEGSNLNASAVQVIPLLSVADEWWAMQYMRFDAPIATPTQNISDCLLPEVP